MSSLSSVCQGLESCVMEAQAAEVVRLKLSPPTECPDSDTLLVPKHHETNEDKGGWSFLQSLSNQTHNPQTQNVYVHPTLKRLSYVNLSEKSLEMCTENLGCENGCKSNDDITALFSSQGNTNTNTSPQNNIIEDCVSKRWNRSGSRFPPPMSSLSEKVLRRRREDGRLILEAVTTSPLSVFKAERSNGRLTLRLFTTTSHSSYHQREEEDDDEEEEEVEADEEDDQNNDDEEELDETGIKKLPRPRRCSENGNRNYRNKQMLDWEPFCVAT